MSRTGQSGTEEFTVDGLHVVVVGGARSGTAAAELLAAKGATVVVSDVRETLEAGRQSMSDRIRFELGEHRAKTFTEADLVVLSPGVTPELEAVRAARAAGVPVIGELELASRWLRGRIVAVTGTKGKSTTSVLAGRLLDTAGFSTLVGGNVGTALSAQVEQSTPDVIHVVEASSFQLELTERFHPWIAVVLNFSCDHLDRHGTIGRYAAAKRRVVANQNERDWVVANADDPQVLAMIRDSRAQRVLFGLEASLVDGVTVADDAIVRRTPSASTPIMPRSTVRLRGRHLLQDVLAAVAIGLIVGATPDAMTRAVAEFGGLEHALETVRQIGGVQFVNDSKATNIDAARYAIESFDSGLVAIVGGRFKGGDWRALRPALAGRATAVVAIGESRALIHESLGDVVPVHDAGSMGDAVRIGFTLAAPEGTVLLAPACASFDMFRDYAERGRRFKEEVDRLAGGVTDVHREQ